MQEWFFNQLQLLSTKMSVAVAAARNVTSEDVKQQLDLAWHNAPTADQVANRVAVILQNPIEEFNRNSITNNVRQDYAQLFNTHPVVMSVIQTLAGIMFLPYVIAGTASLATFLFSFAINHCVNVLHSIRYNGSIIIKDILHLPKAIWKHLRGGAFLEDLSIHYEILTFENHRIKPNTYMFKIFKALGGINTVYAPGPNPAVRRHTLYPSTGLLLITPVLLIMQAVKIMLSPLMVIPQTLRSAIRDEHDMFFTVVNWPVFIIISRPMRNAFGLQELPLPAQQLESNARRLDVVEDSLKNGGAELPAVRAVTVKVDRADTALFANIRNVPSVMHRLDIIEQTINLQPSFSGRPYPGHR